MLRGTLLLLLPGRAAPRDTSCRQLPLLVLLLLLSRGAAAAAVGADAAARGEAGSPGALEVPFLRCVSRGVVTSGWLLKGDAGSAAIALGDKGPGAPNTSTPPLLLLLAMGSRGAVTTGLGTGALVSALLPLPPPLPPLLPLPPGTAVAAAATAAAG
jgi:hypothetical protein